MNIESKKHFNKSCYYGLLIFCSSILYTKTSSQEVYKKKLGFEINVSPVSLSHIGPFEMMYGGAGHTGENYFGIAAKGTYSITRKWSLATGIGYSTQKLVTTLPYDGAPGNEKTITQQLQVWELPVLTHYYLSKYFFTSAGPIIHLQQKAVYALDKQSGIGAQIGLGVQIPVKNSFAISLSPSYRIYSLIPFSSTRHDDRMRVLDVNLGLKYSL